MSTPDELLNRKFEKASFGGYKAADVDRFMSEMTAAISQKNHEIIELKRKLANAEKKVENFAAEEDSLKNTLLNAQRLADQTVKEARERADLTIRDAQIKAENLINKASDEIELRLGEAKRIKSEVSDFKAQIMHLYREHIELINALPSEDTRENKEDINKEEEIDEPQEEIAPDEEETQTQVQPAATEIKEANTEEKAEEENVPKIETLESETPIEENSKTSENKTPENENPAVDSNFDFSNTSNDVPVVKLNLKYNEKTGEYEPIN